MFGCKGGFVKGLVSGMIIGSAASMMCETDSQMMRKMKKKAGRLVKRMEYTLEDLLGK